MSLKELDNVRNNNKLVLPTQPHHDDFLQTMKTVFYISKWFGISGFGTLIWKVWGVFLLLMLVAIEGGAIWKLIKALAGWAISVEGHRSVTARLAGAMFYASSFISLILCWRFSSSWLKISAKWTSVERSLFLNVPAEKNIKRRLLSVCIFVTSFAVCEHSMSMVSTVGLDCEPSLIFKKYILLSHGFLLRKDDYSIYTAIPLFFMSKIATILWNFLDLLIILVSMGLASRYYRLNQYVAEFCRLKKNVNWNKSAHNQRLYTWRKIREAYVKQSLLVGKVDESIGGLILLSNFGNLYFICLQLFLGITQGLSGSTVKMLYYFLSLIWLCLRACLVILAASDVNVQSRGALQYLYGYHGCTYNVEVERLQKQLNNDQVALSGMGFFQLKRTVLLQIVGAVVTYEMVLIQYDNKST